MLHLFTLSWRFMLCFTELSALDNQHDATPVHIILALHGLPHWTISTRQSTWCSTCSHYPGASWFASLNYQHQTIRMTLHLLTLSWSFMLCFTELSAPDNQPDAPPVRIILELYALPYLTISTRQSTWCSICSQYPGASWSASLNYQQQTISMMLHLFTLYWSFKLCLTELSAPDNQHDAPFTLSWSFMLCLTELAAPGNQHDDPPVNIILEVHALPHWTSSDNQHDAPPVHIILELQGLPYWTISTKHDTPHVHIILELHALPRWTISTRQSTWCSTCSHYPGALCSASLN